jgi:hypothetical protein
VGKIVKPMINPSVQLAFKLTFTSLIKEMVGQEIANWVTPLRSQVEWLNDQVQKLQKEVTTLKKDTEVKTDELEQYGRRNAIRIFGVEESEHENVDAVVMNTLKFVNPSADITKISRCHRVGRKFTGPGKPRGIIVKFTSYRWKLEIMRCKSNLKGLHAKTFFNDDLTKAKSDLFFQARTLKRDDKIFGCWTWDGKIFIRETEDSPPTLIRDKDELRAY